MICSDSGEMISAEKTWQSGIPQNSYVKLVSSDPVQHISSQEDQPEGPLHHLTDQPKQKKKREI